MSVLLKLPDELCCEILSEWIEIYDWGLIDIAVSSKCLRHFFITSVAVALSPALSTEKYHGESFYDWICYRKIKLSHFRMSNFLVLKPDQLRMENVKVVDLGDSNDSRFPLDGFV